MIPIIVPVRASTSASTRRDDSAGTTPDRSALAQPFELPNGFVIPNRLAKAALSEGLARRDFTAGTRIKNLYQRWADSGVGLSITGNVMIDRRHGLGEPGNIVVEDHSHIDDLIEWARVAKSGGSKVWVQINHPGRQTPRTLTPNPVAPSPIALPGSARMFGQPPELSGTEVKDLIKRFATTAAVVTEAGFDGVQIHGAHGYRAS